MPAILIGFRAEGWDLLEDFLQTAAALDVDKSKLARLAISYGLDEARRTLAEEQRVQAAREVRVMYLMKAQRGHSVVK